MLYKKDLRINFKKWLPGFRVPPTHDGKSPIDKTLTHHYILLRQPNLSEYFYKIKKN